MFCSISGCVPEQPVVSTKSGHLFEKKLVEKYVRETGKCPVTSEALSLDDLMPLKANKTVKPRPSPANSIPGLLGLFHDEWDALMLETHSLRQSLHSVRQELSHALYLHDASTRVVARLIRERDEARGALQNVKAAMQAEEAAAGAKRGPDAAAEDEEGAKKQKKAQLPEAVIDELQAVNATLSKGRKKRAISESLATPEELQKASVTGSHPLHQTTNGGIVAIDINPERPSVLVTAGVDHTAQVFDHVQGRVLATLQGHSKRLTSVAHASGKVRTGDAPACKGRRPLITQCAHSPCMAQSVHIPLASGHPHVLGRQDDAHLVAAVWGQLLVRGDAHRAHRRGRRRHGAYEEKAGKGGAVDLAYGDHQGLTHVRIAIRVAPAAIACPQVHPSCKYFVTGSSDATWCFYDVEQAQCLRQVAAEDAGEAYTTVQFHPDGLILGTGESGAGARGMRRLAGEAWAQGGAVPERGAVAHRASCRCWARLGCWPLALGPSLVPPFLSFSPRPSRQAPTSL